MFEATAPEATARKHLEVTIVDTDNGNVLRIQGEPETLVSAVVDEMYEQLRKSRQEGDRLWCTANGDSVLAHLTERLEAYRSTHCSALRWSFASESGGA